MLFDQARNVESDHLTFLDPHLAVGDRKAHALRMAKEQRRHWVMHGGPCHARSFQVKRHEIGGHSRRNRADVIASEHRCPAQCCQFERLTGALPAGRIGTAEDVAHGIWLLLTNGFVTGTVLGVDGGHRLAAP